jgi:serine protease Do
MRKSKTVLLLSVAMLAACQTSQSVSVKTSAPAPSDFVERVEEAGVSVVDIVVDVVRYRSSDIMTMPWLEDFFPRAIPLPGARIATPMQKFGAGIVISADGLILTNARLIDDASAVAVRLPDRDHPLPVRVLGIDRSTDVALLKVDTNPLPVASFGHSGRLRAGEWVAAVGSLRGLPATVNIGMVSSVDALAGGSFIRLVPTTNADPSSISGPLLNMRGEVVGIGSGMIGLSARRGQALAVPIEMALDVARELRAHGEVRGNRRTAHIES